MSKSTDVRDCIKNLRNYKHDNEKGASSPEELGENDNYRC